MEVEVEIGRRNQSKSNNICNNLEHDSGDDINIYKNNEGGNESDNYEVDVDVDSFAERRSSEMSFSPRIIYSEDFSVKITGYLDKRSKMLGWRKYWFVLDGRLLTYYKSKENYDKLTAFTGSINIGLATTVRPIQIKSCKGFPLQIITRSQVYILRAQEKKQLEKWLIAIQEASLSCQQINSPRVYSDWDYSKDISTPTSKYSPKSQFSISSSVSQWSLNYFSNNENETLSRNAYKTFINQTLTPSIKKYHSLSSLYHTQMNSVEIENKQDPRPTSLQNEHQNLMESPNGSGWISDEFKKELEKKMYAGRNSPDSLISTNGINTGIKSEASKNLHRYDEIIDFEKKISNLNLDESNNSNKKKGKGKCEDEVMKDEERYSSNSKKIYFNSSVEALNKPDYSTSERQKLENRYSICGQSSYSNRESLHSISEEGGHSQSGHGGLTKTQSQIPQGKLSKKWKSPLILLFHKMFHKKNKHGANNKSMNISGPVDLKEKRKEEEEINIQPKKPTSPQPPNSELFMEELKAKVGRLKRASSEATTLTEKSPPRTKYFQRSNTFHNDSPPSIAKDCANSANNNIIFKDNNNDNDDKDKIKNEEEEYEFTKVVLRNRKVEHNSEPLLDKISVSCKSPDEFQKKLAMFNRLSENFNPNFDPKSFSFSRSNSCKNDQNKPISDSSDLPPPPLLPPRVGITFTNIDTVIVTKNEPYDFPPPPTPISEDIKNSSSSISEEIKDANNKDLERELSPPEMSDDNIINNVTRNVSEGPVIVEIICKNEEESLVIKEKEIESTIIEEEKDEKVPNETETALDKLPEESKIEESKEIEVLEMDQMKNETLLEIEEKNVLEILDQVLEDKIIINEEERVINKEIFCLSNLNANDEDNTTTVNNVTENENFQKILENELQSLENVLNSEEQNLENITSQDQDEIPPAETDIPIPEILNSPATPVTPAPEEEEISITVDEKSEIPQINVDIDPIVVVVINDENIASTENNLLETLYEENENSQLLEEDKVSSEEDGESNEKDFLKVTNGIGGASIIIKEVKDEDDDNCQGLKIEDEFNLIDLRTPAKIKEKEEEEEVKKGSSLKIPVKALSYIKSPSDLIKFEEIDEEKLENNSPSPVSNSNNNGNNDSNSNVKFATFNTIVQELETVEEDDDETNELYDEFPCEYTNLSNANDENDISSSKKTKMNNATLRHSGIDQMNKELESYMDLNFSLESSIRTGAISRLGHSSAIDQLINICNNST